MVDKTFDDLWAESNDYVPQSIEEVEAKLKAAFKKKPNCLYFESKDLDSLVGSDKTSFKEYVDKHFGDDCLDMYYSDTVIGEVLIFERFKEYRGVKVYELENSDYYILETKAGVRYFFNVYQSSSIKGIGNTLVFVDYDGYMTVYDIEKDEFIEAE